MEKELPIILASHGTFAQGALDCAEMLMGKQQQIKVISVLIDSNIEQLRQQMRNDYQCLNQGKGVIILVDLMGGTPCNLASELAITHEDILLFCGFNIPVLLDILTHRDQSIPFIKSLIQKTFSQSGFDVAQMLYNQDQPLIDL